MSLFDTWGNSNPWSNSGLQFSNGGGGLQFQPGNTNNPIGAYLPGGRPGGTQTPPWAPQPRPMPWNPGPKPMPWNPGPTDGPRPMPNPGLSPISPNPVPRWNPGISYTSPPLDPGDMQWMNTGPSTAPTNGGPTNSPFVPPTQPQPQPQPGNSPWMTSNGGDTDGNGIPDQLDQLKEQQIRTKYQQDMSNHQLSMQERQWKAMQEAYQNRMDQQQQQGQLQAVGPPPQALQNWNTSQAIRKPLLGANATMMSNPFQTLYDQKLEGARTSGSGSRAAFDRTPSMPTGSQGPAMYSMGPMKTRW